jgi:AraC-like DNA-binding protein
VHAVEGFRAVDSVDVDAVELPAFALRDDLPPFEGPRHAHRFHQVLYAAEGALRLEATERQWLLPPQRAAWIAANVEHRVSTTTGIALRTLYLSPSLTGPVSWTCRIFGAPPLAREMILHAMRWSHLRRPSDRLADDYFRLFAALAVEWAREPAGFDLPLGRTTELRTAIAFVLSNLERDLSVGEVARAAATSTRTLARRFADETGTSFRAFVATARMLRAMDLLAAPAARVTDVAFAVGFASASAFTAAFTEFAGETPTAYRARRVQRA